MTSYEHDPYKSMLFMITLYISDAYIDYVEYNIFMLLRPNTLDLKKLGVISK